MARYEDFDFLLGKTFTSVERVDCGYDGNDGIRFTMDDGRVFELSHRQSCCESVYIESITGELRDLENAEILRAEEATNDEPEGDYGDIGMWTFYKLATSKGYVDIRFYGSSNGYYGVGVDFYEVNV